MKKKHKQKPKEVIKVKLKYTKCPLCESDFKIDEVKIISKILILCHICKYPFIPKIID